ncbi:MAG: hypothetical protein IJD90_03215 [Clostridia bacterium]|nr:hypothetical protein [Clostridia bacterium]
MKYNEPPRENSHGRKKKKIKHLPVLIAFLTLLLLICAYLTIIVVPSFKHSTIGQMVNYCHNRGSIEFYVNGKLMNPEEMEVVRENGNLKDTRTMTEDGEFAFFSGKKGLDKFTFFATKEESERLKDVKVTFTNYNQNWWIVNNFDLNFDIRKYRDGIYLIGECYLNGEKYVLNSKVQESKDLYYFEAPLRVE